MPRRACVVVVVWLVVLVSMGSGAETVQAAPHASLAPASARLDFEAPASCARRDDLVARVAVRSARIRFADPSQSPGQGAAPHLQARLSFAPGSANAVSADLTVAAADEKSSSRRLVASTCAEAVDALAVIIVVMLDPAALQAPAARAAPVSAPPPAAAPPPAPPPPETILAEPSPDAPGPVWRFGVAAGGHGSSGPAPRAMPGIALDLRATLDRRSIWSPAARLLLGHDWLADWGASGGHASFALDSAELDLCPLASTLTSSSGFWQATWRACAAAIAGRLSARGFDTFFPQSHAQFLGALGAAGLVTVRMGARLTLQGSISAGPNLIRDSFAFSPAVFYRVAPVTAAAAVGLGVTFP